MNDTTDINPKIPLIEGELKNLHDVIKKHLSLCNPPKTPFEKNSFREKSKRLRIYDFACPHNLTTSQLQYFCKIQDKIANKTTAYLSDVFIPSVCPAIRTAMVDQVAHSNFINSLTPPLYGFQLEGLDGFSIYVEQKAINMLVQLKLLKQPQAELLGDQPYITPTKTHIISQFAHYFKEIVRSELKPLIFAQTSLIHLPSTPSIPDIKYKGASSMVVCVGFELCQSYSDEMNPETSFIWVAYPMKLVQKLFSTNKHRFYEKCYIDDIRVPLKVVSFPQPMSVASLPHLCKNMLLELPKDKTHNTIAGTLMSGTIPLTNVHIMWADAKIAQPTTTPIKQIISGGTQMNDNNIQTLDNVQIPITVQLGTAKLSLKELKELRTESIIELAQEAGTPVKIFAVDDLVATGEVLTNGDTYCVRILETYVDTKGKIDGK